MRTRLNALLTALALLLSSSLVCAQGIPITALPSASSVNIGDVLLISQAGTTKQATVAQLAVPIITTSLYGVPGAWTALQTFNGGIVAPTFSGGTTAFNNAVVFNRAITLSPSTGVVSINPTSTGTIDNMTIGATVRAAVNGTTGNFSGHVTIEGVTSTGATGTGKFVFDAAPTLTGHPTIEGVTSAGATGTGSLVFNNSPTIGSPTFTGVNFLSLSLLNQISANTMLGNWTSSSANVTANVMPSCTDAGGNHLNYVNGTGITCGTSNSVTYPITVGNGGTNAATGSAAATNLSHGYVIGQQTTQTTHTGDTNEFKLYSCSVPAGLLGTNGSLRLYAAISRTGAGGNVTLRTRFGAANDLTGTQFTNQIFTAGNLSTVMLTMISNRNSASSQIGVPSPAPGITSTNTVVTAAINTANASFLVLSGQNASSGDSFAVEQVICEYVPVGGN